MRVTVALLIIIVAACSQPSAETAKSAVLDDAAMAVVQEDFTYCLPETELFLGGIELGADSQSVLRVLGQPAREVPDSSEDDGGIYPVRRLYYTDLEVHIGRDQVELLSTTSPRVHTPAGVRVGMSVGEVGRRLRIPDPARLIQADTFAPITCLGERHDPDLAGATFIFASPSSRPRVLSMIRMIEYGP